MISPIYSPNFRKKVIPTYYRKREGEGWGERENDKANGLNCKQLVMLCIGHTDVPCIIRSSKFENTTKLQNVLLISNKDPLWMLIWGLVKHFR